MTDIITPVVKWAGGKRQLLAEILPLIPDEITTYVEPFIGGGAVFFNLRPQKAIINDYNTELINVYKVIKEQPQELINILQQHEELNSEDYFYMIRSMDRDVEYSFASNVIKAARILYLNKTCYNGLYRVNSSGFFNSPYGKQKNPTISNDKLILSMSKYFNNANIKILEGDYKLALKGLRKGSFVYFDPPYVPISDSSSFTGYTQNGFTLEHQRELKAECDKLTKKGIKFVLSNSDCEFIRDLYRDYNIRTVKAKRSINRNANNRGEIEEVLIFND